MEKIFREKDLEKIISHYGPRLQYIKAVEEMSELTKEICKCLIGDSDPENLEEEIADVQIMLNQLMLMNNISQENINYQMNLKLQMEHAAYEASLEAAKQKAEELKARADAVLTDEQIIAIARARFGLVFPDEIIFKPKK